MGSVFYSQGVMQLVILNRTESVGAALAAMGRSNVHRG
jgi:hypothetical protein